ncbi:hypothetical protein, partial [Methanoculleus sp. UBA312]|uniref:hypothetical protein n=1 Tax=Methanoculleus sp. UBA312 TaxID=1915499 RepID=UPI0031BA0CC0
KAFWDALKEYQLPAVRTFSKSERPRLSPNALQTLVVLPAGNDWSESETFHQNRRSRNSKSFDGFPSSRQRDFGTPS